MLTDKTCNHKRMKAINTGAILLYLSKFGPLSRVDLARQLGLDRKTVTNLVRNLLAQNLIKPCGIKKFPTGRPIQLLRLNPDGKEAIGLEIEPHRISGGLVNLSGEMKFHKSTAIKPSDSQKIILSKLRGLAQQLLKKAVRRRLAGIGLAYHGIINRQTGEVLQAARLPNWEGVNVYEFFKKNFRLPFEIEDASRSKAIAEHWFGAAADIDDFLLLDIGVGIGCAVFMRDTLLRQESLHFLQVQ